MDLKRIFLQLIECNIDDMNPELFPYVIDRLLAAGAKDAWLTPIIMKKGRPAQCLSVLCDKQLHTAICEIIFSETTTLGVRISEIEREELERTHVSVNTEYGPVRMKVAIDAQGSRVNSAPEHEDCRKAAETHGVPLKLVYQAAVSALKHG